MNQKLPHTPDIPGLTPWPIMGRMGIMFRRTMRIGPLRLHFTQRGLSSWSIKLGAWSWNSRARAHRVDLPGPFSWKQERHHRRRRR